MKSCFVFLFLLLIPIFLFQDKLNFLINLAEIFGLTIALMTLYLNFLKPAHLDLKIGKKIINIWHDNKWFDSPMIDVFCTFLNNGARPMLISEIQLELSKDNVKTMFSDYLQCKWNNYAHCECKHNKDEKGRALIENYWFDYNSFGPEAYAHPFFIEKYSEKTILFSFKGDQDFNFMEGEYVLKVKAILKNGVVKEDEVEIALSNVDIEKIEDEKVKKNNRSIEIFVEKLIHPSKLSKFDSNSDIYMFNPRIYM